MSQFEHRKVERMTTMGRSKEKYTSETELKSEYLWYFSRTIMTGLSPRPALTSLGQWKSNIQNISSWFTDSRLIWCQTTTGNVYASVIHAHTSLALTDALKTIMWICFCSVSVSCRHDSTSVVLWSFISIKMTAEILLTFISDKWLILC